MEHLRRAILAGTAAICISLGILWGQAVANDATRPAEKQEAVLYLARDKNLDKIIYLCSSLRAKVSVCRRAMNRCASGVETLRLTQLGSSAFSAIVSNSTAVRALRSGKRIIQTATGGRSISAAASPLSNRFPEVALCNCLKPTVFPEPPIP